MKKLIFFVLMCGTSVANAGMCDIVLVDLENAAALAGACIQDVEYAKDKKTAIKNSENCKSFRKKRIAISEKAQKNQREFEYCARLFERRFSNFGAIVKSGVCHDQAAFLLSSVLFFTLTSTPSLNSTPSMTLAR